MKEVSCPDILAIQAFIDEGSGGRQLINHVENCPLCQQVYQELKELVAVAGGLNSEAKLPGCFYEALNSRLEKRPFPSVLVSVLVFVMALVSAYLLNPDYMQWWLSIGITRQIGFIFDALLDLFFLGRSIGQAWLVSFAAALVTLEFIILNKLKTTEG